MEGELESAQKLKKFIRYHRIFKSQMKELKEREKENNKKKGKWKGKKKLTKKSKGGILFKKGKRSAKYLSKGRKIQQKRNNFIQVSVHFLAFDTMQTYLDVGPYNFQNCGCNGPTKNRDQYSTTYLKNKGIHVGEWKRDKEIIDGRGYIIYSDGSLFEGLFKDNQEIRGRYISSRGEIYEGEYGEIMAELDNNA